jgi:dihydroorotate dehydrogenase
MIKFLYKKVLKPLLFKTDPEWVHHVFVKFGAALGRTALGRGGIRALYGYRGKPLSIEVDGIKYASPVMLAAGFDYNGKLAHILPSLSFGGDEIGSVTARACEGNPRPRLKRMIRSRSLVVYKGLRNHGVDKVIERLKSRPKPKNFVWGISIAKTNDAESVTLDDGIKDYAYSLRRLVEENTGDFYTINISCPNVHGGENFAEPQRLEKLFTELDKIEHSKPVYVKMPIGLSWTEFNELVKALDRHRVTGLVIGNLNKEYSTADFPEEAPPTYRGGLSGKPCKAPSTELIRATKQNWGDRFTLIGCGGIMSAEEAMEKLDAGADLLQLISGMIFEGPHLMRDICRAYAARQSGK